MQVSSLFYIKLNIFCLYERHLGKPVLQIENELDNV